jgi:hypothetical protein
MTSHAKLKQNWQLFILALIATAILMASMGCKKTKPFRDDEPAPADLKTREWLKRTVFPAHGEGCDTSLSVKY